MQILLEKMAAVEVLRREIEALRLVAPLLAEAKDILPAPQETKTHEFLWP